MGIDALLYGLRVPGERHRVDDLAEVLVVVALEPVVARGKMDPVCIEERWLNDAIG